MTRARTRKETSAGGVVFRPGETDSYLLILDGNGNWGFPKGHLKKRETPLDAALREVGEETGLTRLVVRGELGVIDWFFRARGTLIHKHCHMYLLESSTGDAVPQEEEGITSCTWYSLEEALNTVTYDNARTVLRMAGERVRALAADREIARGS